MTTFTYGGLCAVLFFKVLEISVEEGYREPPTPTPSRIRSRMGKSKGGRRGGEVIVDDDDEIEKKKKKKKIETIRSSSWIALSICLVFVVGGSGWLFVVMLRLGETEWLEFWYGIPSSYSHLLDRHRILNRSNNS